MSTQFTNRKWRLPNNENKAKQSNYSMDFDGTQSVDVGTVTINNSGSFSIWFKISSIGFYQNILGSSNASGMFKYITLRNGTLYQYVLGTGWIVLYSTSLNDNEWHNLIFTYDSTTSGGPARGTFKSYVDGVLTKTYDMINDVSEDWSSSTLTSIAYFGTTQPFGARYFDGQIDAVSIYNYALSASQVTTLYGSSSTGIGNPMSLSPKPVAYYPLGDQDAFNGSNYLVPNSSLKDYVFDFIPNDYIDCGTGLGDALGTYTGNLTFSIWFKTDTVNPANDGIFYIGDFNSQGALQVNIYNNNIIFRADAGNSSKQFSFTDTTSWHNLTCVYLAGDRANSKLYLDGVLQATADGGSFPSSLSLTGLKTIIGSYYNSTFNFDGKLSNFQIFNTALPATGSNSVETLYNNGSPLTSMSGFTSLVSWYKLNASDTYDSSTQTWTIEDYAGSNDGTSSGMTQANLVQSDLSFTSGYSPYALDFDGANDYIDCGNDSSLNMADNGTDSFTFSFWIKRSSTNNEIIISKQVNSGSFNGFETSIISNKIRVFLGSFQSPQAYLQVISTNTITGTDWKNIVITYDGSQNVSGFNIYINKVSETLVTLQNITPSGILNSANFQISGRVTSTLFSGSLSNVSYWNTELTSAQVTEIYSEGIPQNLNNHSAYSNLVSWWQLGSNSSFNTNWTVLDEKGSNNGTSVNMGEDAIVDGVGSYANGLSSGMGGDEVVGDAPYSTANALSVNMDVEDRVTDTPS